MNAMTPHIVVSEKSDAVSPQDLSVGQKDNMGHHIEDVIWKGSDYAVYRTGRGVQVQFSRNDDVARQQRQRYAELCPELCELRFLSSQIDTSDFGSKKHGRPTLYDYNIAQAIMLAMEEKPKLGKHIARQALNMAVKRATADNTLIYASYCLLSWVIFVVLGGFTYALLASLSHRGWSHLEPLEVYALAGTLGATGAMFSIATRLQNLELKPCDRSTMNKFVGGSRILIGSIAGMLIMLLAPDALVSEIKHLIHDWGTEGATAAAALGFVGGFSERLVPNLLRNFESSDGTPALAARKQGYRSESEGNCGCAENHIDRSDRI